MSCILVTDGEQRAALAVVRSLGRAGHEVVVVGTRSRALAGVSRFARQYHSLPDPLVRPVEFREKLFDLARRVGANVLLPIADPSVLAVLEAPELPDGLLIPLPRLSAFRAISDKELVLRLAPEFGIRVPEQRVVVSRAGASDPALESVAFPVVLKPARSVAGGPGERAKVGVSYATDAAELARALVAYPETAYPVLLQQWVRGPGVGVFLLRWNGAEFARFAHRRLREKPPSGGVSVYRESIPAEPDLVARSLALLERFDWSGVAMIEYKLDALTGTPYLMEVNGRFWGSLQLAIDAGVDFPLLLVDLAEGRTVQPVISYRSGVRLRWWLGDLDHLLALLRRPARALALPAGEPSRLITAARILWPWWPGNRGEIFRWVDPAPALQELRDWLGGR